MEGLATCRGRGRDQFIGPETIEKNELLDRDFRIRNPAAPRKDDHTRVRGAVESLAGRDENASRLEPGSDAARFR